MFLFFVEEKAPEAKNYLVCIVFLIVMFIIRLLGFLDLLTVVAIMLYTYDVIPGRFLISFIVYLLVKGFIFKGDFASIVDVVTAAYMFLMIFYTIPVLSWIFSLFLLQKAIISLLSSTVGG